MTEGQRPDFTPGTPAGPAQRGESWGEPSFSPPTGNAGYSVPPPGDSGTFASRPADGGYVSPAWGGGSFGQQPDPVPNFPPPTGVPVLEPRAAHTATGLRPRRQGLRAPGAVAVAAATALVVGGGAGYGGTLLARSYPPSFGSGSQTTSADPAAASSSRGSTRPSPLPSRTPVDPAPEAMDTVAVAAAALPSTVMLRVGTGEDGVIGSGFVISADGLIMTNSHVVASADDGAKIKIIYADGRRANASLVGRTATYDLAIVRIRGSARLTPMPIGDSDATRVGEDVLAIGAPLGLPGTVTEGIISAVHRPVGVGDDSAANAYIDALQTDAPINPGNSGGPLIDAGGRVIGVNSAILTLSESRTQAGSIGLGFAIPINQAMDIADRLIADGDITYPIIGANIRDTDDGVGVRIEGLAAGGPARDAGLRTGDIVVKVEDKAVNSVAELVVAIREHKPRDTIRVTVRRNGEEIVRPVTLEGRKG